MRILFLPGKETGCIFPYLDRGLRIGYGQHVIIVTYDNYQEGVQAVQNADWAVVVSEIDIPLDEDCGVSSEGNHLGKSQSDMLRGLFILHEAQKKKIPLIFFSKWHLYELSMQIQDELSQLKVGFYTICEEQIRDLITKIADCAHLERQEAELASV